MFTNPICSVKDCQNTDSKRWRMVFVGNQGYLICEKCFDWFRKVGQLIFEDYLNEKPIKLAKKVKQQANKKTYDEGTEGTNEN